MNAPTLLKAAALLLLPLAGFAGEEAMPAGSVTPEAVGVMSDAVTTFFRPQNLDPHPGELADIVNTLQAVGKPNGPTRAQVEPIIARIRLAADQYSPIDPTETAPAPGLAASVQLEVLSGPLRAWLGENQKTFIRREHALYAKKLTPEDRAKLTTKMKYMAIALGTTQEDDGVLGGDAKTRAYHSQLAASALKFHGATFPTYTVNSSGIERQMIRAIDAATKTVDLSLPAASYPASVQEALRRAAGRDVKVTQPGVLPPGNPVNHEKFFVLDRGVVADLTTRGEGALTTEQDVLSFDDRADVVQTYEQLLRKTQENGKSPAN